MKWISTILLATFFGNAFAITSKSVPGEYLLKVDSGVSRLDISSKMNRWGVQKSQFFSGENLIVNLKISENHESTVLAEIKNDPSILLVEPNYIYHSFSSSTPLTPAASA